MSFNEVRDDELIKELENRGYKVDKKSAEFSRATEYDSLTREVKEEDLIKLGLFGFVVARSKEEKNIYLINILNEGEGMASIEYDLLDPDDEVLGILPAPIGTFACYPRDEEEASFSPNDLLYIEYPGERTTHIKEMIQEYWIDKKKK